jgi:hypothetical protein
LRPKSRPLNSRPVLAAAGACASSRPSNAGCSRARRPALPQQPGRRRDTTCFIPTPCRRAVASAIGTLRAHRLARVVRRADPCRDRRNGPPIVSDVSRLCLETLSRCASGEAQRTSRPPTPAQPKHQIPIRRALHTACSFLGDFPTPNGVRNSSRKRNVLSWAKLTRKRTYPAGACPARLGVAMKDRPSRIRDQSENHRHGREEGRALCHHGNRLACVIDQSSKTIGATAPDPMIPV